MNPGGILAQWFHYYGMSRDDLLALLNTFSLVFEHVEVFEPQRGDLILLGSDRSFSFDFDRIRSRMNSEGNAERLKQLDLPSLHDLLALYQFSLDGTDVPREVLSAKKNTDDNMLLEFSAPKHLYDRAGEENRELLFRLRNRGKIYRGTPGEHLALAEGAVRAWDLAGAAQELDLEEASPSPFRNGVHNLRGRILLLRAGQEKSPRLIAQALAEIEAALACDSTSSTSYFLKGSALLQEGSAGEAVASFQTALRLGEDPALALCFLGMALERSGQIENAINAYRDALALDQANPIARQGLNRLATKGD